MIKCYQTNKRTRLHHDLIEILGIMAVQIWLKMLIFFVFLKLSLLWIFTLTADSKYKHFNVAYYIFPFIMKKFGTF